MLFYEDEPVSLFLKGLTLIKKITSQHHEIALYKHAWLGKVLIIDNEIQHIEKYQALYHELLVHIPASFVPKIKKVLILGGGSLFAASEILKYPSVEQVILCDHDSNVIKLMGSHYKHAETVLSNTKFKHINLDVYKYISTCNEQFDLIINDCFNISQKSKQYNISYYKLLLNLCSPHGACVDIIYRHIFDTQTTIDSLSYLQQFNNKAFSLVTVPEYPGILHLETIWGKSSYISQSFNNTVNDFQLYVIENDINDIFEYFHPNNLSFYLYLPPYIKKQFNL